MPIEPAWLQAGSTIVLVAVTGYYTYLLHRQNKRERRSYHADTLRDRVREWLEHFPQIKRTGVESAEPGYVIGKDREFRVVPSSLAEDHYFQDLLNNHGDELQRHKTNLQDLHEEFESLKDRFMEEFDDTEPIERAPLDLEPTHLYAGWVFERALILERSHRTKEDLHGTTVRALERNTSADNETVKYSGDENTRYGSFVLTRPRDDSIAGDTEIVGEVLNVVIDRVDSYDEYTIAREAAGVLDEMESEVNGLRTKLVEYEGMATYPGRCKYLE